MAGDALGFAAGVVSDSIEKAGQNLERQKSAGGGGAVPQPSDVGPDGPKALFHDPFSIIDQLGYKDRPTGITYHTLCETVRRVSILGAIIQTRCNQVANFAQLPDDPRDPGFGIRMRDDKAVASQAAQKKILELQDFFLHTGATRELGKDDFETYIRKTTRDALIYDQACTEVEPGRGGAPVNFYAVDGATVRIADVPVGADTDYDPDRTRYVQIYDEVVIAEFAARELCFGIRNPRTDIRMNGYGYSEIEMLISVVTALLWGFEYNKRFFSQGSVTKGILNFRGSIPDSKLEGFRRHWYQLISGVANSWRTPVTNAEELQYINMHSSNRDMEFAEWMNFLIKVSCAIYQIEPTEINFVFGATGQTQSMFQSGTENRVKHSKDKGLRPLLRAHQRWLNRYVLWQIDPDFSLYFTGLDPKDVGQEVDLQQKKVKFLMTVDEARAEEDLEPLPDGKGEVILDPTWLQYAQGKEMADQEGAEGEDQMGGGPEGEEPEGEGEQDWAGFFGGGEEQEPGEQQEQETTAKSLSRTARVRRADGPDAIEYEITL